MTGRVPSCTGDDSCKVPWHWQSEVHSGPHREAGRVRTRHCRHCGSEIVPDDAGGWLHEWTMSVYCPERIAEPDPREYQP